jgi:peptidoglycan hydrolase CwlO-like protein
VELEKSMNLLREKCETFQNSLIDKENEIFELSQENSKLRTENFELNKELKESQEYLTKLIWVFERELRDNVNPFKDRTAAVVNGNSAAEFLSPKVTALSQNTSPMNLLFVSKAKRFLRFGDENAF